MDRAADLVAAFVGGAQEGRSGNLNIVGDVLYLDGWWQASLRLADDAFIVRAEPPPEPSGVLDDLAGVLQEQGLSEIPGEHPLIQAVTYAELSLVGVAWTLWAPDAQRGEAALGGRAAPEPQPQDWEAAAVGAAAAAAPSEAAAMGDLSAEFAASLLGGMPTSVVLTVGLADAAVAGVEAAVPDCRVEARSFGEAIEACGVIVPHLVLVDASGEEGRRFLLEFRAEACGRHVPVAAITGGELPSGADTTLDPASPSDWAPVLQRMLP